MTNSVTLRPVEARDFDDLSRIMFDTWYAEDFTHPTPEREALAAQVYTRDRAEAMARFDTAHYLETSTHAMVAVEPASDTQSSSFERVLGIAMWRNDADWDNGMNQKHLVEAELDKAYALEKKDAAFAHMLKEFLDDAERTITISQTAADESEAELRLFMMDENARGKGVGKRLLSYAEESMRDSGAQQYYLYTDSTCDFGFYDYRGMTRMTEKFNVPGPSGELLDKFIYTHLL